MGDGLSDELLSEIKPDGVPVLLVEGDGFAAEQLSELDDGGLSLGGEDSIMSFWSERSACASATKWPLN